MNLSEKDIKTIATALIRASNMTETEWLSIEKTCLESLPLASNENVSSNVQEMWNHLYRKIKDTMDRMKKFESKEFV